MYLLDGPHGRLGVSRCAYTRKQLQVVPDNENPPPDSVLRGNPKVFTPEKILGQRIRQGRLQYLIKWRRYRTPNNLCIGQMKISKFTMINKQTIFNSAKQTLIMT